MFHSTSAPAGQALIKKEAQGIQFTFRSAPGTSTVCVAGTFNCWQGKTHPLTRIDDCLWQCTVPLSTGRHLYKYVIDDQDWIRDPSNPWISEDGQNNSCITIDASGEIFIRTATISQHQPGILYQRHQALPSPQWLKDGVIYQLSVRAFGGTFIGAIDRLAYLSDLGVDILWIMPVQPIGVARRVGQLGDPYATRDFDAIDGELGSSDDFGALVDAAHRRGMRVILDWTLNRSSCDNPLTRQHPDWYTRNQEGEIFYAVPNRDYFSGWDFANPDLRRYLITSMGDWIQRFDIDGFRFDDSDITPLDFLVEIRAALQQIRPNIALLSQAYDEFHHLGACDLTYDGGPRDLIKQLASGAITNTDFETRWSAAVYSFPRNALRLRWLEEKEQPRAWRYFGEELHRAAATILLTMDGVPHLMMGQEFNERRWENWTSLFNPFELDWMAFDDLSFKHYRALIQLRHRHPALRQGDTEFLPTEALGCIAYARAVAGDPHSKLYVTVNLSAGEIDMPDHGHSLEILYADGLRSSSPDHGRLAAFGSVVQRVVSGNTGSAGS